MKGLGVVGFVFRRPRCWFRAASALHVVKGIKSRKEMGNMSVHPDPVGRHFVITVPVLKV
jgi:hypothetical protein